MEDLDLLKAHLKGKIVILGIGNTLRSDDGVGSILASRIKDKVHFKVFDAGVSPENYLDKIIKEKPANVIIIDAVDFDGKPGEFRIVEGKDIKTVNLFSTHNVSISLIINYLQNDFKIDIINLIIQPRCIGFGDNLSPEIEQTLNKLENWLYEQDKQKG